MNAAGLDDIIETDGSPHTRVQRAAPHWLSLHYAWAWVLAAAALLYVFLAFRLGSVKTPWVDEGWVASAPANWAHTGSMGSPSLEPTGSWLNGELTGIREYTYWNLPVPLFAQGLWYKLFGFSLLTMRALGVLFGLVMLVSWFGIVATLSKSRLAGALAAFFLSIDFTYLWIAADGRMDMMCAALGSAGLACYLVLRERHWTLALWLANGFLALALFTHPNGVIPLATFAFLVLYLDRARLSWRDLTALTPYFVLACAWGVYILQHPDYFLAQFSANANARGGNRFGGLANPGAALKWEIVIRYLIHYSGAAPALWTGPVPSYTILIPGLYWLALLAAWLCRPIRRDRGLFILPVLAVLYLGFMTLFVGLKASCYLVYILPLYTAVLAVWVWTLHTRRSVLAPASLILAMAMVVCQAGVARHKIRRDTYSSQYLPTVEFVRQRLAAAGTVVADSYFGIDLGFDRVRDDVRLGFYSGIRPELIIQDAWYSRWWNAIFSGEEPEVTAYVHELLETRYRVVFERGPFRVYERRRS